MRTTKERLMPDGSLIVADISTDRGYFSVTGEKYEKHGTWNGEAQKRNGREPDSCGQLVDDLRRAFPEIGAIMDVHLADAETGEPMHAGSNGWYFYSGAAREYEERSGYGNPDGLTDHERAARALQIEACELPEGLDAEGFAAFVESLRPRWADRAAQVRDMIEQIAIPSVAYRG